MLNNKLVHDCPDALNKLQTNFSAVQDKVCNLSIMQRLAVRLISKVRADSDLDEDTESLLVELEVLAESLSVDSRLIVEDLDHVGCVIERLKGV